MANPQLSARNDLPGIIEEITRDTIMCHVVVRVGDHQIESVITRRSADDLNLKKGDSRSLLAALLVLAGAENASYDCDGDVTRARRHV